MNSKSVIYFFKVRLLTAIISLFVFNSLMYGNVRLPHVLSSNMVLQRNVPITIWGWADAGEKVNIVFAGKSLSVKADKEGNWKVVFPPMKEGGPYTMTLKGKNSIILENILIGEVWICSGQSNMEWMLYNAKDGVNEVNAAKYPEIRLFTVPKRTELKPVDDLNGGEWQECSPQTAAGFSAVGYFFGRELYNQLHIPIGLINTSWGGTLIEPWTSDDALYSVPGTREWVDRLKKLDIQKLEAQQKARYDKIRSTITGNTDGIIDGKPVWAEVNYDDHDWISIRVPGLWEQSLFPGLDGVVWFRFEFEVPVDMTQTDVKLSLGKIDDSDITWINGVKVGETEQKYDKPRIYNVYKGILKPGKNVITVRVDDTGGGGGFWSEESELRIENGKQSVALSGEWKCKISPTNFRLNEAIVGPNDFPSVLFNGMIYPLLNYAARGVIWYQGESNCERAFHYRTLFPLMINNWREKWRNPDLVFLFVQLANYKQPALIPGNSDWAELREAQLMTLSVPKTGMAVIIDIGEANDIHPRNKQDVGYRLSLAARKIAYNEDLVYSGPIFKSYTVNGSKIEIEFDHIGSGLIARDKYGYLKGFTIAGEDQQFKWAKAYIHDNKVIVFSEDVKTPVAVRYAWADNPDDANLYNKEGLPASPFRTDKWKAITE
jgi:sialate O-acetylesterase